MKLLRITPVIALAVAGYALPLQANEAGIETFDSPTTYTTPARIDDVPCRGCTHYFAVLDDAWWHRFSGAMSLAALPAQENPLTKVALEADEPNELSVGELFAGDYGANAFAGGEDEAASMQCGTWNSCHDNEQIDRCWEWHWYCNGTEQLAQQVEEAVKTFSTSELRKLALENPKHVKISRNRGVVQFISCEGKVRDIALKDWGLRRYTLVSPVASE